MNHEQMQKNYLINTEIHKPLTLAERVEVLNIIKKAKGTGLLALRVCCQLAKVEDWQRLEREKLENTNKSIAKRLREIAESVEDIENEIYNQ